MHDTTRRPATTLGASGWYLSFSKQPVLNDIVYGVFGGCGLVAIAALTLWLVRWWVKSDMN